MKYPSFPRVDRGGLAAAAVCALLLIPPICRAEVITIYPEADTKVDSNVPFPYQGTSGQLYVGYDPNFGNWIVRSYLRFSLAGVNPVDHILSARLNLYADTVYVGGNVDLYRSENDTWVEASTNFGNQPGYSEPRLDTLFVTHAGVWSWELLRLLNWEAWKDVADEKVTLMIKTPELTPMTGVSFGSREGTFPIPSLVLTTRRPGEVFNSDFENGGIDWLTSGTVSIIPDPEDAANHVAQLQTDSSGNSSASIRQTIDTPDSVFFIEFSSGFENYSGTLTVSLGGVVLLTVSSPDEAGGGVAVIDPSLRGRQDLDLVFALTGPADGNSGLLLDDVAIHGIHIPQLSIDADHAGGNATLSFFADPDGYYQIQRSLDGVDWDDHGRRIAGLDLTYEEVFPIVHPGEFYRLQVTAGFDGEPWEVEYPNNNFELPVLGDNASTTSVPHWTSTGGAGVWNPTATHYPPDMFEDSNVAYIHQSESLSQTLNVVLEPYRIYYLYGLVGKRTDIGFPLGLPPDLKLRAGGVELTPFESDSPEVAAGTFEWWERRFRIGKDHPQLGQSLEIVLDGGTSGITSQVNFDNVFFDYE